MQVWLCLEKAGTWDINLESEDVLFDFGFLQGPLYYHKQF